MTTTWSWLPSRRALAGLAIAAGTLFPMAARAQTATGGLRGYVRDEGGQPLSAAQVQVKNAATGYQRTVSTTDDGFYAILGLTPADYQVDVRRIGGQPQTRTVHIAVGQIAQLDFSLAAAAVEVQALTVTVPAATQSTSAEQATNVSQQQIQNLPSSQRNFLDFAALAPGITLQGTGIDATTRTISYGAQGAEQINVFVDGATYKNDMILGGVVGENTSRGNPFPMSAIQEYRVLTQNYRAEYQRASSAVITAATRSGTNTWEGSAFLNYQDRSLVARNAFQATSATTFAKPDYTRDLYGVSLGGPLIRDRLFFFGSFEGNRQNRTNHVAVTPPAGYSALDTFNFHNGDFLSPFRQSLFFGKLTYAPSARSNLELSFNTRTEYDIRDFGGLTAYSAATRFNDAVNTAVLKHTYTPGGNWMNEATVSYQHYRYNPVPNQPGPYNLFFGFGCCAQLGSNVSMQDFTQNRLSLRNDLTYTGLHSGGDHVIKLGANVDFARYDEIKRNSEIPRFVYELWHDSARTPERVEFQAGDPNLKSSNNQIGAYIQDDWSPSPQLTLNLGVRWDFETNMLNTKYVTPSAIRDSVTKYADSLFLPLDPNNYFSTGSNRKPYYGGFQPRLGLTYALDRDRRTTLFGGWGLFQDRDLYDWTVEETFANQHPSYTIHFRPSGDTTSGRTDWSNSYYGGAAALQPLIAGKASNTQEVKLLPNNLRPPTSQQFTAGIRRVLGDWSAELSYTGVRSNNVFTFYWANSNFTCPQRSFGVAGCFVTRTVPGYGTILFAQNGGKTWYDALNLKLDRPFSVAENGFGWSAGVAYTYAKRQTQGFNDEFSFPNPVDYPKQVRNDEAHHLVANWVLQSSHLWDVQFGGLFTFGSGVKYDVGDRFGGTGNPLKPGGFSSPSYFILDLHLRKQFGVGRGRLGVSADLFNALNRQNFGCYNTFNPSDPAFGTPSCMVTDPQRLQVGMDVGF